MKKARRYAKIKGSTALIGFCHEPKSGGTTLIVCDSDYYLFVYNVPLEMIEYVTLKDFKQREKQHIDPRNELIVKDGIVFSKLIHCKT